MDRIIPALEMMGQGMAGIFVVLGIIALVVNVMQKFDNPKKKYISATECSGEGHPSPEHFL